MKFDKLTILHFDDDDNQITLAVFYSVDVWHKPYKKPNTVAICNDEPVALLNTFDDDPITIEDKITITGSQIKPETPHEFGDWILENKETT